MMTMLKTISALISASFLLVTAPAAQAGDFSISIGYSSFGHHHGRLPYSYKPFAHPKTIYYSPLRLHHYSKPYPKHYYSPGYPVKHHYYIPKPRHYNYKHYHDHGHKDHYDKGYKKYYYKNHYRGSYQKIPQKIYIDKR